LLDPSKQYAGDGWAEDILRPWLAAHAQAVDGLHHIGQPQSRSVSLDSEVLWGLYAFSRTTEYLTASFQPAAPTDYDEPFARHLPRDPYPQWVEALGGWWPSPVSFHPFLHEIVDVQTADEPTEPPSVVHQWWPGFFVESMLMARAGVTVRSGRQWMNSIVARSSTLYWAWTRRHRPVMDLSHGWGGNSQWRTNFRRDYWADGMLHYNVDAMRRPNDPYDDRGERLTEDVAIELVRHRCSITKDHGDVWVYDSHHTEPAPAWPHRAPGTSRSSPHPHVA
jgi:hypothetical protein